MGCGAGDYGILLRMYFEKENWGLVLLDPSRRPHWKNTIDGLDVFAANVTGFHRVVYDALHVCDIRHHVGAMPSYDVILLLDVIEHLDKQEGRILLQQLFCKAHEALIVSTPLGFRAQGPFAGNDAETHRSGWWPRDFKALGVCFTSIHENQLLAVLCKSSVACRAVRSARLKQAMRRTCLTVLGARLGEAVIARLRVAERWCNRNWRSFQQNGCPTR